MRILWLTNVILPIVAKDLSKKISMSGGWISGLYNDLKNETNIELAVCFPVRERRIIKGEIGNLKYYGFTKDFNNTTKYSKKTERQMKEIIRDFNPGIVHIFGTEFPHTLTMVKAFNNPDNTIINIQGLCSAIAKHYFAGLPLNVLKKYTLRDYLTNNNIINQKIKFVKRGNFEIAAMKSVKHIIGRTHFDKACTEQINPSASYYSINESLREVFYNNEWKLDNCEKNTILLSQGNYSIKGLHFLIEALSEIVKVFSNTHLFIAGTNIIKNDSIKDKLKRTAYSKYIEKIINTNNLTKHITFTGILNEQQMCERYLKSHIFVSASSIENSPNSLGEAMLLGLPVISSDVGGIKSLMTHNVDGFLYQYDASYMLAYYICKLFKDDKLVLQMSDSAKLRAKNTHNKKRNADKILKIYEAITLNKTLDIL